MKPPTAPCLGCGRQVAMVFRYCRRCYPYMGGPR